ncbi:MAG: F-box protein [Verrucomicrobia bacterium]|nr:F-box protein [Verrucomicrobiota bacterium]
MTSIHGFSNRFFTVNSQHTMWGIYAVCLLTCAGLAYALWQVVVHRMWGKANPLPTQPQQSAHQIISIAPAQDSPQIPKPSINLEKFLELSERTQFKDFKQVEGLLPPDIWRRIAHYLAPKDICSLSELCKSFAGIRVDPYVQLLMTAYRQVEFFARQLSLFSENGGKRENTLCMSPQGRWQLDWSTGTAQITQGLTKKALPHASKVVNAQWIDSDRVWVAHEDKVLRLWKRDTDTALLEIICTQSIIDFWYDEDRKQMYICSANLQLNPIPDSKHSLDIMNNWVGRHLVRLDLKEKI